MASRSIEVSLDRGELFDSVSETVRRADIGPGGARGLWDDFGTLVVRVNTHAALALSVRQDPRGRVVLEISGGKPGSEVVATRSLEEFL